MYNEIVKAEVAKYLEVARDFYPDRIIPMPTVKVSSRMTRCGGTCRYKGGRYTLTFSKSIMENNNLQNFLERTVPHELAHQVQHVIYGDMDHGRTFNYVMRTVFDKSQTESTRCHNYKTVARKRGLKYIYACKCCGSTLQMGATRHKNQQSYGGTTYRHSECGTAGKLEFTGKTFQP